jgi:hypothetical protein
VRLYLGNKYIRTISAADAEDSIAWDECTAYAEASCPMSAVRVLGQYEGNPAFTTALRDKCLETLAGSPIEPDGSTSVVLGVPEPQSCMDDFAVQIFSNDAGQITAVNLLTGSP